MPAHANRFAKSPRRSCELRKPRNLAIVTWVAQFPPQFMGDKLQNLCAGKFESFPLCRVSRPRVPVASLKGSPSPSLNRHSPPCSEETSPPLGLIASAPGPWLLFLPLVFRVHRRLPCAPQSDWLRQTLPSIGTFCLRFPALAFCSCFSSAASTVTSPVRLSPPRPGNTHPPLARGLRFPPRLQPPRSRLRAPPSPARRALQSALFRRNSPSVWLNTRGITVPSSGPGDCLQDLPSPALHGTVRLAQMKPPLNSHSPHIPRTRSKPPLIYRSRLQIPQSSPPVGRSSSRSTAASPPAPQSGSLSCASTRAGTVAASTLRAKVLAVTVAARVLMRQVRGFRTLLPAASSARRSPVRNPAN
jgi:hypothetical protein